MENNKRIRIFDTTLRDGEQAPGASLNPEEKIRIARQLAKYPSEALDVLARRARPGEDYCDGGVRDVDALVQNLRRSERQNLAAVEGFEPSAPLLDARLVRDCGDEERTRDSVDHLVLGCEDENLLAAVPLK